MDIKSSRELSLGVICCANKYQISDGAINAFGGNDCRYFTVTDCDGNKRLYLKGDVHLVINGLPAKCNTNQPTRSNATPQVQESITIFGESYSDFTTSSENEKPLVLFPAAGQTLEQLNAAIQQILRSCCCNEPQPPFLRGYDLEENVPANTGNTFLGEPIFEEYGKVDYIPDTAIPLVFNNGNAIGEVIGLDFTYRMTADLANDLSAPSSDASNAILSFVWDNATGVLTINTSAATGYQFLKIIARYTKA
jgi:hypothetical protein